MLYLVDQAPLYRDMMRQVLYRYHMYSEGVCLEDLPPLLQSDTKPVCLLLRPDTYDKAQKDTLSALCGSHIPLIYLAETREERENVSLLSAEKDKAMPLSLLALLSSPDLAEKCAYAALRCHGISDDLNEKNTRLFGLPMALTPIERMILRYMLYVWPKGATAEELLHYCMRPNTDCTIGNIPTHIRQINRAFMPCYGNRIITHAAGAYRLMEKLPHSI